MSAEWKLGLGGLATIALAAVVAGACGSNPMTSNFGSSSGGASSSGTGASSGGASSGASSGTNLGGSSGSASSGSSSSGGGPTQCDPSCAAAGGTCTAGSCTINENPGSVSTGNQTTLGGTGTADSAFAWQYPYDKTVFPRGLLPLTLQFAGTNFDAAKVTVTFPGMNYTGFYGPGASADQIKFSAATWTAITAAAGATSPVQVQVTKVVSGAVSGPVTETWTIAQGNIRGTIYYETYGSEILGGAESVGIMKIQPGATAPTPLKSGCGNVCHTASADGST